MMNEVGGILTGEAIRWAVDSGAIEIDPYEPKHINPASIDLRLGDTFAVYRNVGGDHIVDVKVEEPIDKFVINSAGVVLHPGTLYLMHTRERVHTKIFAPVLDGKSSIGRLGIKIHETAGYGDPGFDGQYTLEVSVQFKVRVYAGMRFCQMRFTSLVGEHIDYRMVGNYIGTSSVGPVPSKVWKQFKE